MTTLIEPIIINDAILSYYNYRRDNKGCGYPMGHIMRNNGMLCHICERYEYSYKERETQKWHCESCYPQEYKCSVDGWYGLCGECSEKGNEWEKSIHWIIEKGVMKRMIAFNVKDIRCLLCRDRMTSVIRPLNINMKEGWRKLDPRDFICPVVCPKHNDINLKAIQKFFSNTPLSLSQRVKLRCNTYQIIVPIMYCRLKEIFNECIPNVLLKIIVEYTRKKI
jgi:hypothetical protein